MFSKITFVVLVSMVVLFVKDCAANAEENPSPPVGEGSDGATPNRDTSSYRNLVSSGPDDVMKKLISKGCAHRYSLTCLKMDLVSFVDRLSETPEYQVLPGVSVVQENSSGDSNARKFPADLVASLAKDYPNDVDARVDAYLVHRVGHYLDTHALNVKLFDADSIAAARKLGEAAMDYYGFNSGASTGRGKDKKGMGALLAAAAMMKGTLGAVAMGGVAMLAGKALMVGLMSLMLAAIVGLKSLAGGGGKAVTYEIVSKPVYSHEHTHSHEVQHGHGGGGGGGYGHSSYGRSFDAVPFYPTQTTTAQQMAYAAYAPQQQ